MSTFVHLHTHSHYSLLSALPKINDLVKTAKESGMRALALTDNGNLYGAIDFYKTCTNHEIKPIFGVDFYVARRTRHDREPGIDHRHTRLVLLAENNTGYQNLITLVTRSYLEGFYYKPRIDGELMKEHNEGLIAIIPATDSRMARYAASRNTSAALTELKTYKDTFGEGNVFLEVTHHPDVDGHQKKIEHIVALGRESGTPLVAGHDIYYLHSEDRRAWETLRSIQSSIGFREQNALTNDNADFSFPTTTEMEEHFRNMPKRLKMLGLLPSVVMLPSPLASGSFLTFPFLMTQPTRVS